MTKDAAAGDPIALGYLGLNRTRAMIHRHIDGVLDADGKPQTWAPGGER